MYANLDNHNQKISGVTLCLSVNKKKRKGESITSRSTPSTDPKTLRPLKHSKCVRSIYRYLPWTEARKILKTWKQRANSEHYWNWDQRSNYPGSQWFQRCVFTWKRLNMFNSFLFALHVLPCGGTHFNVPLICGCQNRCFLNAWPRLGTANWAANEPTESREIP